MAQGQTANPTANTAYPKFGFWQQLGTAWAAPSWSKGISNVYAQQVANAQLAQQLAGRQQAYGAALGVDSSGKPLIDSMPNVNALTPEEFSKVGALIGNQDFGQAQAKLNRGEMPTNYGMAPAAQVQQQGQDINKQQAANVNYQAWLQQQPKTFQQGQQAANGFIQGPNGLASQMQQPAGLDDGTGNVIPGSGTMGPALAAGTTAQGPAMPIPSPFLSPSIAPADMNTPFDTGVTNAQAQKTLNETSRHNQKTEGLTQQIIDATKGSVGGYANNPSYPPLPNAAQMAYAAFQRGDLTPGQYAETLGAKGPQVAIPGKAQQAFMTNLANEAQDSNGIPILGWGAHPANPQKIAQYNRYAAKYGYAPLPFEGNPQSQEGSATSSFAAWKAKKK